MFFYSTILSRQSLLTRLQQWNVVFFRLHLKGVKLKLCNIAFLPSNPLVIFLHIKKEQRNMSFSNKGSYKLRCLGMNLKFSHLRQVIVPILKQTGLIVSRTEEVNCVAIFW